jgi:ParB-like chromosome segregation protein Spo0J
MTGVFQGAAGESVPVVATLKITDILPGPGIRCEGINEEHVKVLAGYGEELPPIIVQKSTLRVIDGMHRLRAAQAVGQTLVQAQLLDVDDSEAFLYGVNANISHGLPLSLTDRKAAARKILEMRPEWSDRAVAKAVGLSGKTIGVLRTRESAGAPQPAWRMGLDGRVRPLNGIRTRQAARDMLTASPDASLREIAREVRAAPATVRKVRDEMAEETASLGSANVVGLSRKTARTAGVSARAHVTNSPRALADVDATLAKLRQDPALKYRTSGRGLLRLLHQRPIAALNNDVIEAIPAHCAAKVAELARIYAREWLEIAGKLETMTVNT